MYDKTLGNLWDSRKDWKRTKSVITCMKEWVEESSGGRITSENNWVELVRDVWRETHKNKLAIQKSSGKGKPFPFKEMIWKFYESPIPNWNLISWLHLGCQED